MRTFRAAFKLLTPNVLSGTCFLLDKIARAQVRRLLYRNTSFTPFRRKLFTRQTVSVVGRFVFFFTKTCETIMPKRNNRNFYRCRFGCQGRFETFGGGVENFRREKTTENFCRAFMNILRSHGRIFIATESKVFTINFPIFRPTKPLEGRGEYAPDRCV